MSRLQTWLADGPLLTDGAWGTELYKHGLAPGACPDLWNLTRPDAVAAVARSYVEAGSQVILTNTFRANAIALGSADIAPINRAGVTISRQAAGRAARVVASLGPSGKMLVTREVSRHDLTAAFSTQARALAEAGADALLIETMSDIDEATIAAEAALTTGLPVIVSFVFDSGAHKDRTMTGATPEAVATALTAAGVDAVGANCGVGPARFVEVCRRLRDATALPVWVKPNAGLPVLVDGRVTYDLDADGFAAYLPALLDAGTAFVGGCCGTTPAFIRTLATTLARVRTDRAK